VAENGGFRPGQWDGANPLSWAAGKTAAGNDSATSMKSRMLSVSFVDALAGAINVSGLAEPFVVAIDLDPAADAANDTASCAHWNEASGMWVDDGALLNRTDEYILCSFPHRPPRPPPTGGVFSGPSVLHS
jgi:hypothetical protein